MGDVGNVGQNDCVCVCEYVEMLLMMKRENVSSPSAGRLFLILFMFESFPPPHADTSFICASYDTHTHTHTRVPLFWFGAQIKPGSVTFRVWGTKSASLIDHSEPSRVGI